MNKAINKSTPSQQLRDQSITTLLEMSGPWNSVSPVSGDWDALRRGAPSSHTLPMSWMVMELWREVWAFGEETQLGGQWQLPSLSCPDGHHVLRAAF